MDGGNGGKYQSSCQAGVSKPFGLSGEDASGNEHIVAVVAVSTPTPDFLTWAMLGWITQRPPRYDFMGETHSILEPAPYWPDTGNEQITCSTSSSFVSLLANDRPRRPSRGFRVGVGGRRTGIRVRGREVAAPNRQAADSGEQTRLVFS